MENGVTCISCFPRVNPCFHFFEFFDKFPQMLFVLSRAITRKNIFESVKWGFVVGASKKRGPLQQGKKCTNNLFSVMFFP